MSPGTRRGDPRIADALLRAASTGDLDPERLVAAVPAMLSEAARRRRAAAVAISPVLAAARSWLPRLALATATLLLAALLWPAHRETSRATGPVSESESLERWLVTGSAPARVADPVLDALVR